MPTDPITGAPLPYGDEAGAPPPGLMEALLGGGGGGMDAMGADPMGADPMMGAEPGLDEFAPDEPPILDEEEPDDDMPGDPSEQIRTLIAGAQDYMDIEPDDEDKAEMAQILARLQKLLARNQQQADQAQGVGPPAKFMRRQTALGR